MAKSVERSSWKNGYREAGVAGCTAWAAEVAAHYKPPPSSEILTSDAHNDLGLNVLRTWPTIYNGTNTPHDLPKWWRPRSEVDVLICGAGPAGLQVALSLVRQGVSFRIVDKGDAPLLAGRADGVQPRFLELLHSWGLATEVHEEGPLIERTAIYKDGKKLLFNRSHQSDSRYRGLHIITQGQLERIYIRDLLRHHMLVERSTVIEDFNVKPEDAWNPSTHPVHAVLRNAKSAATETVRAKFLVGADGASSMIRKKLGVPFHGVSTDIYWGIMDCVFESDYPHAWVFGSVISSKYGGCVIIPREDGYIRLYTQLDVSATGGVAKARQAASANLQEDGGRVDTATITPDEVLAQANRIFAPYTLKFASPLSWFAVWKISERVAQRFSSLDNRVHLAGDAAHVHSVMGAFGLNASMMDSSNLAWKIGLCARGLAKLSALVPTYDQERRHHAQRIIRISGSYLRFVCGSDMPLADFDNNDGSAQSSGVVRYEVGKDHEFLRDFFSTNGQFILGVDAPYDCNAISPAASSIKGAVTPRNGVRAPNPRLCFSVASTGYLYDALTGADIIHLVIFASDLRGPVRKSLTRLSSELTSPHAFFHTYGARTRFNPVLVCKGLPSEVALILDVDEQLAGLKQNCKILYDDRAPDEDAHTCYEVSHARGAIVVVRPDLWIGTSCFLDDVQLLEKYFGEWLLPVSRPPNKGVYTNGFAKHDGHVQAR